MYISKAKLASTFGILLYLNGVQGQHLKRVKRDVATNSVISYFTQLDEWGCACRCVSARTVTVTVAPTTTTTTLETTTSTLETTTTTLETTTTTLETTTTTTETPTETTPTETTPTETTPTETTPTETTPTETTPIETTETPTMTTDDPTTVTVTTTTITATPTLEGDPTDPDVLNAPIEGTAILEPLGADDSNSCEIEFVEDAQYVTLSGLTGMISESSDPTFCGRCISVTGPVGTVPKLVVVNVNINYMSPNQIGIADEFIYSLIGSPDEPTVDVTWAYVAC